jgi:hypothetical protein
MPKAHVVTKFCNCSLVLQDLYSTSVGWMKRTRKRPYIAKSINHQYFQHSTHKGIIRRPYKGIIRRPYIAKSMSHQYFQHSTHKGVISGCQEWNNSTWVGKKKKSIYKGRSSNLMEPHPFIHQPKTYSWSEAGDKTQRCTTELNSPKQGISQSHARWTIQHELDIELFLETLSHFISHSKFLGNAIVTSHMAACMAWEPV